MTTMYELKRDLVNDLESNKDDILSSEYPEDEILEYVDSWIPVYNGALIEALQSDHSLAEVEDSGLLPENPGVYDIIRCAIYEQLLNEAHEWLQEAQEELEENADESETE
jgi:hypothetical protein